MIPNHVPMVAVYLTSKNDLIFRPVVAWQVSREEAVVSDSTGKLSLAATPLTPDRFLGLWVGTWTPTYDQMASLLPENAPGTPHPLTVHVTLYENCDGTWSAQRTDDDMRSVAEADTLAQLRAKLSALGNFTVDKIFHLGEY